MMARKRRNSLSNNSNPRSHLRPLRPPVAPQDNSGGINIGGGISSTTGGGSQYHSPTQPSLAPPTTQYSSNSPSHVSSHVSPQSIPPPFNNNSNNPSNAVSPSAPVYYSNKIDAPIGSGSLRWRQRMEAEMSGLKRENTRLQGIEQERNTLWSEVQSLRTELESLQNNYSHDVLRKPMLPQARRTAGKPSGISRIRSNKPKPWAPVSN